MKQLSMPVSIALQDSCRPNCRQQQLRQFTFFRHGARHFASGRPRRQHHPCYGRRRTEEYETEDEYEETYEQAVVPDEPISPPQRSFPKFVAIPGIMLLAFTMFRIVKQIQGRG